MTVGQASATDKVNVPKFVAGNLATHMQSWRSITSDSSILEMMAGYSLVFDNMPFQPAVPHSSFSKGEELIIAAEIKKLLKKGGINEATHGANEYISTVFTRPIKDGSHRLILNLKNLNQFVTYPYFKMESLQSAVQVIQKDYWMAVLELKDAYYSVPINPLHKKYLIFEYKDTLYEFTCLPNGLASAPRVFTKVMKPIIALLRSKGYLLVIYIDDILLLAATPFASRPNYKVSQYVAWKTDTGAIAIDSFALDWSKYKLIYCFPPFSLIGKVLQYIQESNTIAILVIPYWPTQFWYPHLLQLLKSQPLEIKTLKSTLTLPYQPEEVHPYYPQVQIHGSLVSGLPL